MPPDDELNRVLDWRLSEAVRLGLVYDDALDFAAGDGDLNQLRRLIRDGCDPHVAARIAT